MHEVERRYADQSPAFLVPRLLAAQFQGQQWEDSRQRVIDDHIVQLRAMGADDLAQKWLEVKPDMGAISIQGDTYQLPPAQPVTNTTTTNTTTTQPALATKPASGGLSRLIAPVIVGGALTGAGVGGTMLYHYLTDKPNVSITNPVAPQDWKLGVSVTDKP